MKIYLLGWTAPARDSEPRHARVWNGTDWIRTTSEVHSREAARLFPQEKADQLISTFRRRFAGIEEITAVPIMTWQDHCRLTSEERFEPAAVSMSAVPPLARWKRGKINSSRKSRKRRSKKPL